MANSKSTTVKRPLPSHLWIDQYGSPIWARTVNELCQKAGGGKAQKMFRDKADGTTVHCGYIVGGRWFNRYAPVELPA